MAEQRKGGPIINTGDLNAVIAAGALSQQRREEVMKKRQADAKKAEDMKKITHDAGISS